MNIKSLRTILLILTLSVSSVVSKSVTAYYTDGQVKLVDGHHTGGIAWGTASDERSSNGWIKSFENCSDCSPENQAYAAGYIESALTTDLIYDYWLNYVAAEYGPSGPSDRLVEFMTAQLKWMRSQVHNKALNDQYWEYMGLLLRQYDGLVDAYTAHGDPKKPLSAIEIYMLNSVGDLEDLNGLFDEKFGVKPITLYTDCTGFIKVTDDDLICGQATWRSYYAMLRVYKIYDLSYVTTGLISFSSSPGFLHSKDDFYAMKGSNMVVMETTNSVFNKTLYESITPHSALSWQRVMAANSMTVSGVEWTKMFAQYNSGTYNNQWMVVDLKLFKKSTDNILWIIEQIPGYTQSGDVSSILLSSYWPSYNIPYFVDVYNMSGYPGMVEQHGDDFSYDKCARSLIFKRNASSVESVDEFMAIMRYNGYPDDPLSPSPEKAIASRYDLRADNAAAFGAVDAKVTSVSLWDSNMTVHAICGPTHSTQPPFNFKDWPNVKHEGVPELFNFDWIDITPQF